MQCSPNDAVGYMGSSGAYGEQAARGYFTDEVKTQGFPNFSAVFDAVQAGQVKFGIVPMENSESGTFRSICGELASHKVFIVGEYATQEQHCLCVLPGVKQGDIDEVSSHPAVLRQCSGYWSKMSADNKKPVKQIHTQDTASACASVREGGLKNRAAVASRAAAEVHQLEVLQSNIGDDARVSTRWIVISKEPAQIAFDNAAPKCSLALSIENQPGALYKVLSCFAMRDLNVIKMETRPASTAADMFKKSHHWQYVFFIDFAPSASPATNAGLMANLKEFCISVRDFGTYLQNLPETVPEPAPWLTSSHY